MKQFYYYNKTTKLREISTIEMNSKTLILLGEYDQSKIDIFEMSLPVLYGQNLTLSKTKKAINQILEDNFTY